MRVEEADEVRLAPPALGADRRRRGRASRPATTSRPPAGSRRAAPSAGTRGARRGSRRPAARRGVVFASAVRTASALSRSEPKRAATASVTRRPTFGSSTRPIASFAPFPAEPVEVLRGEDLQVRERRAVRRVRRHPALFLFHERDGARGARDEAELAVEPPRAGLERLGVAVAAELVREDREDVRTRRGRASSRGPCRRRGPTRRRGTSRRRCRRSRRSRRARS